MSSHRGSRRGVWRGKRGSRLSRADNATSVLPKLVLPPSQPFGPVIDKINGKTLLVEEDAPTVKNAKYVASYNWVNATSPIILVPGSPPAWNPPAEDRKLKPDSEDVFRDINAARYASYPLEPAFRALLAMNPDYDLQIVDIVGCGNTIGNLLRYAGSQSRSFRFDVDVVGDTVLFVRKERSPTELITDLQGYGHTFPEAYTTWDPEVRNSCSHQRIVEYEFGGMKFLVRTETDGYVKQASLGTSNAKPSVSHVSLDDGLRAISVNSQAVGLGHDLEVRLQGKTVPQNMIFDLKTRANYKSFDMEEIFPRLWASQTSKFLIAYHQFGLFNKPKIENVTQSVLKWEARNSSLLARFQAILKRIVDVVRDSENQQCEVSWDGEGPLLITKQIKEGKRALPSDLVCLWEVSS